MYILIRVREEGYVCVLLPCWSSLSFLFLAYKQISKILSCTKTDRWTGCIQSHFCYRFNWQLVNLIIDLVPGTMFIILVIFSNNMMSAMSNTHEYYNLTLVSLTTMSTAGSCGHWSSADLTIVISPDHGQTWLDTLDKVFVYKQQLILYLEGINTVWACVNMHGGLKYSTPACLKNNCQY